VRLGIRITQSPDFGALSFLRYCEFDFCSTIFQVVDESSNREITAMSHAPVHCAGLKPIVVELKAGETYAWCACGRSANQPFCDGSHQGTGLDPVVFIAEKDARVAL